MPTPTHTIATHNLYRGKATVQRLADIQCHQEVKGRAARRRIKAALPDHRHVFQGQLSISWRADRYKLIDTRRRQINRGIARVTPDRWALVAVLRDRTNGNTFAVICTHWVNPSNLTRATRILGYNPRNRGRRTLQRITRRQQAKGRPVLAAGDINTNKWDVCAPILKDARHKEGAPGLDRIMYTDGWEVRSVTQGKRAGSDHRPIIATFTTKEGM